MTGTRLFANVLGSALIAGFLGALFALFIIPIPAENRDLVTYMLGQLSGFAGGIIAHHYASKAGEQAADGQRARLLDKTVDLARETLAATPAGTVKAEIVNDAARPVPVDPNP